MLYLDTSSLSPSTKSKGVRLISTNTTKKEKTTSKQIAKIFWRNTEKSDKEPKFRKEMNKRDTPLTLRKIRTQKISILCMENIQLKNTHLKKRKPKNFFKNNFLLSISVCNRPKNLSVRGPTRL